MASNKDLFGKRVVFASWLGAFCLFGFRSTFAVLKDPIADSLGWTQSEVTLGYSLMMVFYAITAFFSGIVVDRWGTRPAYAVAAAAGAASFVISSQASSLYMFYLSFGLLGGISTGMLWITSIVSVRKWFVGHSYATMWGLAFAGAPMSQLVLSYVTRWVLAGSGPEGWRTAMLVLAVVVTLALILASKLAKDSPEKYGMRPYGEQRSAAGEPRPVIDKGWGMREAFKTYSIWAAIIVFLTSMMGEFLIWTQVVSFWTADLNWSLDDAVTAYAMIGLAGIFAMPLMGVASDWVVKKSSSEPEGRRRVLIIGPMIGLVACGLLLQSASDRAWAYASAVVFAFYWAAIPGGVVGYVGSVYGRATLGKIWGLATFIVMGVGPFAGSFIGAYLRDLSGSYTWSLYYAAASFVVSVLVAFTLPVVPIQRKS